MGKVGKFCWNLPVLPGYENNRIKQHFTFSPSGNEGAKDTGWELLHLLLCAVLLLNHPLASTETFFYAALLEKNDAPGNSSKNGLSPFGLHALSATIENEQYSNCFK